MNTHSGEMAITVESLNRVFGEFYAVKNVNFSVVKGEFFGFLGANGAGKSTTIRILCGLLAPSNGNVTVAGVNVLRNPNAVKQRIGYMSQKFSLYPDLPVEENLRFFAGAYGLSGKKLAKKVESILDEVGLTQYRKTLTGELSGGWQQRVALGNSLLHNPDILFLDEPTAGVDPAARREFISLVKRRVENGATVFLTTHYLDEAEFCDRVGLMATGELVTLGTPAELKNRHVPGDAWIVQVTNPTGVRELLSTDAERVALVQPYGNGFRIRTKPHAFTSSSLLEFISTKDHTAVCMKAQSSLDDVFHAVVGGTAR